MAEKHPGGRPSIFTADLADAICERLVEGESLRSICRGDDMPNASTVCRWLAADTEFCKQYARAREAQADTLFDEILDIADDGRNDWMERSAEGNEGWQLNGEHVQRSRIRIDARKWMAGKLAAKKYGEKQLHEHTGKDGGPIELADRSDTVSSIANALRAAKAAQGETLQ